MCAYNNSFFTGITTGLTNTYSVLAGASTKGVTLASIASAKTNTSLTTTLNQTFASYIQTNFSSLDKDGNGVLSATELESMTTKMSTQGMTAAQLSQLGTASGMSSDALSQVLEHFRDIDANGDGKVTSAEISAYKLTSAMEKKKTEFANRAAANQSVFYGSDDSSTADSSSLLDYKYMNTGSSSSSSTSSSS